MYVNAMFIYDELIGYSRRMTESVRDAIDQGIHPKMISKGSSGSYFVRAKVDGRNQIVGLAY